ncbi:MAG: glycosyltransferase [Sphingobacteriaceae bacterium]
MKNIGIAHKLKILLLMDPFIPVPPVHYGGIERVIYDIANQYVNLGHQVTLVAGPHSLSPDRLITYGENGSSNPNIHLKTLFEVYRILFKEIKNHDVIHNFGRLAFLIPFLKNSTKKIQTYMRYVDINNIKLIDQINPKNLIYTAVSNIIANTGKTNKSQWRTVYNCAPINQFEFKSDTVSDGYLAFLGRIEKCKGLHNAIKVARQTNRNLIIAGNISDLEHERIYFEREIRPLIDGIQIKYIGPVDNAQKNDLLGNASALLTPVEWLEPFPIIIPEAYACGTPVLGFNNGGIPEGIQHGVTGFISENIGEMSQHVNQISLLSRYECRKNAEKLYSDHKIASDYLNIYNE